MSANVIPVVRSDSMLPPEPRVIMFPYVLSSGMESRSSMMVFPLVPAQYVSGLNPEST